MAVFHGKNGKVKLSSNTVLSVTKITVNEQVETADSTAMGDTAQTHESGIPGWSATVEAVRDSADTTGQEALTIGASVSIDFFQEGDASGKKYRSGTATVTGLEFDSEFTDNGRVSIELQGDGALTRETVA